MKKFFNPYPKYLQIRQMILQQVTSNMRIGDQFPTEQDLSAQFGVSRETVRAALLALEEEGIITRSRGRGTFLQQLPKSTGPRRLTGMSEDFSSLNLDTEARILDAGEIAAPREIIEAMRLEPETPVWRILRLRLFEGLPLARHEAILPVDIGRRVSQVDLRKTSVYRELSETLKVDLWEDYQIIDAVIADPAAAELLGVAIGAPLLSVTRLYLTEGAKPVVLFRSVYRSDRYYYTIKLTEPGEEEHPRAAAAAALPIDLTARRVRSN